jgi:serine protease Do
MGTGVIIDPRGYILTNYHVVDGVREIQITMADAQRFTARLVARDADTDLAIIKIDGQERLPVIATGTSSDLMAGESVVAVGNAYGYEHTVTRGIVSALHRAVQVSNAQYYDDLIQTDASINPGNSGGPLLNIDGEMIGINVAVRAGAQGIGFAIPVDKVMGVAATLLAQSNVKTTWHGVVTAAESVPPGPGVSVASVEPESPAAENGLKPGDRILAIDGTAIARALDFQRGLLDHKAGDKVKLSVQRESEAISVDLALAEVPERLKARSGPAWDTLGLELKPIATKDFQRHYQTRYRGGLSVAAVRPDSPAASQGIRPGDVLVGMHIWETISLENVIYILNRSDFAEFSPVKFFILRGNETLYGHLAVAVKTARRQ